MRPKLIPPVVLFWLCLVAGFLAPSAHAAEMKLEAQLIWGTTNSISPDPKHKPVDPEVAKKIKKSLPFKWEHYFEVERKQFTVSDSEEKEVEMSRDCSIKVTNVGRNKVQLNLYGRGKLVGRVGQVLPKGELLIIGGDAENLTAWFVVLKRVD